MRSFIIAAVLLVSCSGGDRDDGDDGSMKQATACGLAGTKRGNECSGLGDCGAGAANAKQPNFCDNCLMRPDTHVCEAGVCRALGGTGNIMTAFGIPEAAAGAKSFTVATIHPVMADGSEVTCTKLMSTCGFLMNPAINTTNSTFKRFAEPARTDSVYPSLISAEAGTGRLLFIQITSDEQGKGTVLAQGCAEGLTVNEGETVTVPVDPLPL